MKIDIITLFPQMLNSFFESSILKRAINRNLVSINFINPRDFTNDKHHTTDDRPFGGGPGMIMKPEPLFLAVESVKIDKSFVILLSPSGKPFKQEVAESLSISHQHLIMICGHYEGIDERVIQSIVDLELSIGDYVLTNGALAAAVVSDAVIRLIPGVIGAGEEGIKNESFTSGILDFPQYTKPVKFRDMEVPEVLLSGNHELINKWRIKQAIEKTIENRPDLISTNDKND
jgi:tRNA (guanine37-N1)-methyltransferase